MQASNVYQLKNENNLGEKTVSDDDKVVPHNKKRRSSDGLFNSIRITEAICIFMIAGIIGFSGLQLMKFVEVSAMLPQTLTQIDSTIKQIQTDQKNYHEDVLLITATYATKEDLQELKDETTEQLHQLELRLELIDAKLDKLE